MKDDKSGKSLDDLVREKLGDVIADAFNEMAVEPDPPNPNDKGKLVVKVQDGSVSVDAKVSVRTLRSAFKTVLSLLIMAAIWFGTTPK